MKETINIFEILGDKKEDPQLDVFKILSDKAKQDQEQKNAPDFDLYQNMKAETGLVPAPKAAPPKPVAEPPKPVKMPEPPKPVKMPEPSKLTPPPVPKAVPPKPVTEPPKPVKIPEPPKPAPPPVLEPAEPVEHRRFSPVRLIIKLAVFVIIAVLLLTFVAGFPKISMNSMEPMISDGDRVIISKVAKDFRKNDIIVFEDDNGRRMAARIVAVKGDVVSLNNTGGLYVNNKLQEEEYIHTVTTSTDTATSYPIIVNEDSYFVLGDNRTDSLDSRNSSIGLIETDDISGKVVFCFKKIK